MFTLIRGVVDRQALQAKKNKRLGRTSYVFGLFCAAVPVDDETLILSLGILVVVMLSELSELSKKRKVSALNVGDDHVFLLVDNEKNDTNDETITAAQAPAKSVIKVTKRSRPDPLFSSFTQGEAGLTPDQISLLSSLDLTETHKNAEYSNYDATAATALSSTLSSIPYVGSSLNSLISLVIGSDPSYGVEVISPASERQIARATPNPPVMIRESPKLYKKVVLPYLEENATPRSLNWVYNCVDVKKVRKR